MGFESFTERRKSLVNFEAVEKPLCEYKEVSRLSVVQGEMIKKKTVVRSKFSQLKDKRFYFTDFKKEKGQKMKKYFWEEKEVLFNMQKIALKSTPRLP